jgi:hypothetical protein
MELIINDARIPRGIACQEDMRKILQLGIRRRYHVEVRQALTHMKRKYVTFTRDNALTASTATRRIMNKITEVFKLSLGVDRLALTTNGILGHDEDTRSVIDRVGNAGTLAISEPVEGLVSNSSDINTRSEIFFENTYVVASESTIRTTHSKLHR